MEKTPKWLPEMERAAAGVPPGRPIVMINLLRFADDADYGDRDEPPCSGQEAYARYSKLAMAHVLAAGGELVWVGAVHAGLIQPADERWDEAVLVRYPSIEAFVGMIRDPAYQSVTYHREAALGDSRLLACEQGISSVQE